MLGERLVLAIAVENVRRPASSLQDFALRHVGSLGRVGNGHDGVRVTVCENRVRCVVSDARLSDPGPIHLTRYLVKVTDQGGGAEASAAPWTALAIHEGCSNWRAMTSDKITTTISVITASATAERDPRMK